MNQAALIRTPFARAWRACLLGLGVPLAFAANATAATTVLPSDPCSGAQPLAVPSTTVGTTVGATPDTVAACSLFVFPGGVWYRVTGNGSRYAATVCNGAGFPSAISVFCAGCTAPEPVLVAEDSCGSGAAASWCTYPGVEYRILVHGQSGATGSFQLELTSESGRCAFAACGPPLYTIPDAYAGRDTLVGDTIQVVAYTGPEGENVLLDDFTPAIQALEFPPHFLLSVPPGSIHPVDQPGAVIWAVGTLGVNPFPSDTSQNLAFTIAVYETLRAARPAVSGTDCAPALNDSHRAAESVDLRSAAADPCKIAVLISGGASPDGNRGRNYFDYMAVGYDYVRGRDFTDQDTSVYYANGEAPQGNASIPAAQIGRAKFELLRDRFQRAANVVKTCSDQGKATTLYVVAGDHGNDAGEVVLWRDREEDPKRNLTSTELRDLIQGVVDRKLGTLWVDLHLCYAGQAADKLRGLQFGDGDCDVRCAAVSPGNRTCFIANAGKKAAWFHNKICRMKAGDSPERALLAANQSYDEFIAVRIPDTRADSVNAEQEFAKAKAEITKKKCPTVSDENNRDFWQRSVNRHKNNMASLQDSRGGEQYFRSWRFAHAAESREVQVTPGGTIDVTVTPGKRGCGELTVHAETAGGNFVRLQTLEWKEGKLQFRVDSDRASHTGLYRIDNDGKEGTLRVLAVSTNPKGGFAPTPLGPESGVAVETDEFGHPRDLPSDSPPAAGREPGGGCPAASGLPSPPGTPPTPAQPVTLRVEPLTCPAMGVPSRITIQTGDRGGEALVRILDVAGRARRELLRGPLPARDVRKLAWDGTTDDGRRAAPGMYYCRVMVGMWAESRPVILLR